MEFENYKEKQAFYRKASKTGMVKYQSKKGGRPYVKDRAELEEKIKKYKLERLVASMPKKEVSA